MSDTHQAAHATGQPLSIPAPAPSGAIEPKADKHKRIPKRLAEVIQLVTTGECSSVKAAAERCGYHPNYLYTAFKKPEVRVFIERKSRETIAAGMMRASARLNQLVDAASEHVSFDATKHVLALAGIKPAADAQVSVNIDIKAGYVIDLSDNPRPVVHGASTLIEAQAIDNTEDGQ